MRRVLTGFNLSGQTLDANAEPGGHARESLILNCNLTGATILGDVRGTDFFNSDLTNCSLTGAQLYGGYWRGNTLTGIQLPADIGALAHHELLIEVIKQGLATITMTAATRAKVQAVRDYIVANGYNVSWEDTPPSWWTGSSATLRTRLLAAFRATFAPYPSLAERFEALVKRLQAGLPLRSITAHPIATVTWPDGAAVTVDGNNLPVLPELSRFALKEWIQAQADAQRPGPHYCWVAATLPSMTVHVLSSPDDWWQRPLRGY